MSGSKAGAARARSGKGRGNAGATPASAARQGAASARDAASRAADAASPAREAAADAGPREGEYVVTLPTFEGPLDLLLHLIQQHELDILDIPVSFVTEKYLEYLKVMGSLSIDLSSEYLVMAATLAHIKSKMLLPSVPAGQDDDGMPGEEEDPRAELVRRLLEYQKYKGAAAELTERGTLGRDVFTRGMSESEVPQGPAPFTSTPIFSLLDAFERVLKRTNVQIDHEVVFDRISITDRMVELTEKLSARRSMRFEDLLLDSVSKGGVIPRFELVITFLAVLEMCKLRLIRVHQTDPLASIHIQLSAADGAPAVDFEIEDGAPAVERIETAGGEEAGAPPAAGEGGVVEPAEVEGGEPAWPEGVEPSEPSEPMSGERAGTEPAEAVEAPSGEPGWSEMAEPAEESSGEPAGPELAGPAEEASRAHDIAGGEPATEADASPAPEADASPALEADASLALEADASPALEADASLALEADASLALEETERDALAGPSDLSASEDTAAPPTEVDEVDAGSGRDGG